ncbi:hypothetical protein QBC42DRAFT_278240 [Cladorrhinum samala]|uniref:DUF4139 domain-containing protein n=1 Tax=Cladorrhinum samala TaxID=585594 RepID=A0AAV9HB31_9PEZI|nr:hypothetical protein QBC42DRAFT_278240 [Cladorrhinum samala]
MDTLHKQSFFLAGLPTRTVTLFPTRAQVVRDIKDVVLKPGANEITVVGITPTADEQSIKVEGSGSAIITDITVELLPNREIFQEVYPESDSEEDSSSGSEDEEEPKVNQELENIREKITGLNDELARVKETAASASRRLAILDGHCNSLANKKEVIDIASNVETYRIEREKTFTDHMKSNAQERDLVKQIQILQDEERRLQKLENKERAKLEKEKAKAKRAKAKIREKERRREAERKKEKARIKKEREQFWPRQCYSVRITLEASGFTPSSSRRSSIASAADVKLCSEKDSDAADTYTCDLSISYLTSSAFWSPTYDLALNTQTNTATLCFDARLTNMTSETWSNSRVILSTSEAAFSGLQDDTPTLVPWRVKLGTRGHSYEFDGAIRSREERAEKENWNAAQNAWYQQKPRANLFGVSEIAPEPAYYKSVAQFKPLSQPITGTVNEEYRPGPQAPGGGLFGNTNTVGGGLFGNTNTAAAFGQPQQQAQQQAPQQAIQQAQLMALQQARRQSQQQAQMASSSAKSSAPGVGWNMSKKVTRALDHEVSFEGGSEDDQDSNADNADTVLEATPELSFQESCVGEEGLTTNYELPNIKTLKPSSTSSKQRVARVSFSNVAFSRTVVAKYKPAAYLKARIRNTSKLTLLKGSTGITLDGTFLGRSALPRCSAGDSFKISLGIDPGIKVLYPKPEVRRSTTGVFTKGDNSVYTRTITLVNTRVAAGKPVDITVLDQVPVSEDEKLKVDVIVPRGLLAGAAIATGWPGKEGADGKDWGRAIALMKKAGEVGFEVSLNAGKSVKLVLEYELSLPTGERVVQV